MIDWKPIEAAPIHRGDFLVYDPCVLGYSISFWDGKEWADSDYITHWAELNLPEGEG